MPKTSLLGAANMAMDAPPPQEVIETPVLTTAVPATSGNAMDRFLGLGAGGLEVDERILDGTFVHYAEPKSSALWTKIAISGTPAEGEPYLFLPEPERPIRLDPFRFCPIAAKQYWGDISQSGELLAASPCSVPNSNLRERVECVVLVLSDKFVTPANMTLTSVKAAVIHRAQAATKAAKEASWGDISEAHKASLEIPDPRFRFFVTSRTRKFISKSNGFPYFGADGAVSPMDPLTYRKVAEFFADEENAALLNGIGDVYSRRVQAIVAKFPK
jgi:hypothetical protein